MRSATLVTAASVLGTISVPALADVLYDNGPVNGVNGYSNATSGVFGFQRTVLDDFVVPANGWTLQDMHWTSVWTFNMGDPIGIGANISIRADDAGTPGPVIAIANLTDFSEVHTGNFYFERPEKAHWATFSDIALPVGHYWFEATIIGGQNNFWLTADQNLNECWVNYEDLGGFTTGTDQFGVASDINFVLGGVPVPGALALLGLAAVARTRRRG